MSKMKQIFALVAVLAVLVPRAPVSARPLVTADLDTPGTSRDLLLPPAADNSQLIYLGQAVDPGTGELVEGYAFVKRPKAAPAKGGSGSKGTTVCYGFLARGAKWKTIEPWVTNPANAAGLDETFVFANLMQNINKWEDGADGLVNGSGLDVLGAGSATTDPLLGDTVAPDDKNEVYFANISDPGAIGVTIVWGIFSGPTFNRKLVEWDQIYDDQDFGWSASGETGKMDFENISTHELGHSVGLADLYNTCVEETMYGYAGAGETKKRDLNAGDLAGMNSLY